MKGIRESFYLFDNDFVFASLRMRKVMAAREGEINKKNVTKPNGNQKVCRNIDNEIASPSVSSNTQ